MNDPTYLCIFGLFVIAIVIWLLIRFSKPKEEQKKPEIQKQSPVPTQSNKTQTMLTPSKDRFVEVVPGTASNAPRSTLIYNSYGTNSAQFIREAQKYHVIEGRPVEAVPFMQYWPTFSSLDEKQKNWYFFLRSEIRQRRYPSTDLSYIFIYIYELLCLVEISDPGKAAEQIKIVWRVYRSQYHELDRYLPEWGGDLLAAKVGLVQCIAWWWELMAKDGIRPPDVVINSIVQRAVDAGKITEIPYVIWTGLNLYHPQNKFYQRYNQDGEIDRAYFKAIRAVDTYFVSMKSKKGILERYASPKSYVQKKLAFVSAIKPDDYPKEICFGEARNYAGASRVGNLLAAITKYTENILRKQSRFAARLSGFELEEKLQRVLDEAFSIPAEKKVEEPVRIKLDTERIKSLKKESEQVRNMLTPEIQEPRPLYSDIIQVRALWEKLEPSAKNLLLALYEHKLSDVGQLTSDSIDISNSPYSLIDKINNLSLPLLGDRIISVENRTKIMIADDFVDEMEIIAKETPVDSLKSSVVEEPVTEEQNPWQQFIQQLSTDEFELLSLLSTKGVLPENEIEEFARVRGKMGNLLMDTLNEKAIEQLGRMPFYFDDDSWFIEEEDMDVLREAIGAKGE